MAGVTFTGVTKRFGDVTAVDRLDLTVDDGEFVVLLGPSGCGKTTALRMIAGLDDITEGELRIGDRLVNHVDPRQRRVAMVFQSYALYPHLSVAKNIESPLLVGQSPRLTREQRSARVAEAARALDLEPFLARKPSALSGGQRQRVALARAIVARPLVFLMDEPLSNLDAKLRTATRAELVDLHRRLATTIVYVTHDQVEAMTMAGRIAIMADGRRQQVGTPQEVHEEPANLFVARFIGTPPMNTVTGSVDSDGVAVGDGRLPVPARLRDRVEAGRPVVVGIRPEHLAVGEGPAKGTVRSVEWLGHECLVACAVGDDIVIVRQGSQVVRPAVGDTVSLAVDPALVHLFDAESGERIP